MLRHYCDDLEPPERLAALSFDEMSIKAEVEYDKSNDSVLGPYSDVQVIMIRGLVKKYKQPVYFDFDKERKTLERARSKGRKYCDSSS